MKASSGMVPRTDPVEYRETEFVKAVAATLDRKQQSGAFDRLIIAAAPIALGDIRKAISPAVRKTVVAELNKDLTNLPTSQLDQHFDGIIFGDAVIQVIFQLAVEFVEGTAGFGIRIGKDAF